MDVVAAYLTAVFVGGAAAVLLRLPPLIGFLAAGFALNAAGSSGCPPWTWSPTSVSPCCCSASV